MLNLKSEQLLNSVIFFIFIFILSLNDFRHVIYDSEPDYLANALSILQYGYPLNGHHPGTISYYLLSLPVHFLNIYEFELSNTIYVLRFFLGIIGSLIVLSQDKLLYKTLLLILLLIMISPGSLMVMSVVSAEILLLPLSIVLVFLIKNFQKNLIKISLLFGLLLNIKLTSLVLIPFLILGIRSSYENKRFITFIKSILIIIGTYITLLIPVLGSVLLPFIRIYAELANIAKSIFLSFAGFEDLYLAILLFLFLFIFILLIIIFVKKINFFKLLLSKFNEFHYSIILFVSFGSILLIFCFDSFLSLFQPIAQANLDRHFLVALPFMAHHLTKTNFLNSPIIKKIFALLGSLILLILLTISRPVERMAFNPVDDYINASQSQIFLFPTAGFNSEYHFLAWSKYRYGKSEIDIPLHYLNKNYKDVEFLNVRNIQQLSSIEDTIFSSTKKNYAANYKKCIYEQLHRLNNDEALLLLEKSNLAPLQKTLDMLNTRHQVDLIINIVESHNYFLAVSIKDSVNKIDMSNFCIN